MSTLDRRSFLKAGGATVGATLLGSTALQTLSLRLADAAPGGRRRPGGRVDYGRLRPTAARNTGERWLALPAGFSYTVLTSTGAPMTDGTPTPRAHDGMGAFPLRGGRTRLICNHEIRFGAVGAGRGQGTFTIDGAGSYDPSARGGTTSIDFDPRSFRAASGGKVQDFVSMRGSVVNCAGGVAYGAVGWITSEEIVQGPDVSTTDATAERHGYNFLVPLAARPGRAATPPPLTAMGRFAHEAAAVDPDTGTVYQTEDAGSGGGSGFYRFLPRNPADLSAGGRLQMLAVAGDPRADLREGQRQGERLPVRWVTIEQPDPSGTARVYDEGYAAGGAKFNRLEGCWYGDGSVFFASTSGGDVKNGDVNRDGFREGYGQIWEYRPGRDDEGGELVLLFESPDGDVLDSPDNIVVTPRGGLLICEDDASSANLGQQDTSRFFGEDKNRLIGLTLDGVAFPFAENIANESELAGACFSADGEFLFVNVYGEDVAGSGGTLAITGPWQRGAL